MTAEQWRRISAVFAQAQLLPAAERSAYLDVACDGFPEDRRELEELLAQSDGGPEPESAAPPGPSPVREARADPAETRISTPAAAPPGRFEPGQTVGRYSIIRPLKPGGMGVLYLAEDNVRRQVVLKLVAPEQAGDPQQVSRFRREAEAMGRLQHPGIATLYAFDEVDGVPFLVSEFVRGRDLRDQLEQEGPYEPRAVIDLGMAIAEALGVAHDAGIIHRDLKPENIMLPAGGGVKLVDFGIARLDALSPDRPPTITAGNLLVGTPAYMTPEQLQGRKVDHRCDLFSLGIVLYEMATGANPFSGRTRATTLINILNLKPPPMSSRRPLQFGALERIVARCLEKDPDLRYGSTRELLADLAVARRQLDRPDAQPSDALPGPAPNPQALWWWIFHQVVVCVVNGLLLIPLWMVRDRLPVTSMRDALFFGALATFAISVLLRLGPAFFVASGFMTAADIFGPRRWLVFALDTLFSLILAGGALAVMALKPSLAALLLPCALGTLGAMVFIEPVTTRAAFGQPRDSTPAP